jgi:hypothetical protein
MAKYRKKPVVVEAVQYKGNGSLVDVGDGVPDWIWKALETKTLESTNGADPFIIHTLEGDMIVNNDDWIIKGVKGELYPCKPDIFEVTYEPVI